MIICSLLGGCSLGLENKIYNNLSEIVDFVVCGDSDAMSVSFMCGRREVEYKINGYSTELIPYGVLCVSLKNDDENIGNVGYVLFVGTIKYQGDMQKNPYDGTWVADIKTIIDKNENISVDIVINETKSSFKLKSVDEGWNVASNDLVEMLVDRYKEQLKSMVIDSVFEGEVYIKLITDTEGYSSQYYYYVAVVDRKGGSFNFLVSPKTKEILASNNTMGN